LERGIHKMGQPSEQGKICQGGDEATGQDDFLAADAIGQCPEDQEKWRADQERKADERVRWNEVELEIDQQEEQGVELPRVPHHALSSGRAQQRQGDVLVVRVLEEAVDERSLRALAL